MFRKLVANLSYSPSLVGELSAYDRRLKREVRLRGLGLIVALSAVVVQALVTFAPPESANPASASDLIYGGISTPDEILAAYDKNAQNFRDLIASLGITRQDLASLHAQSIRSTAKLYSVSHLSVFGSQDGVREYVYPKTRGGQDTVYLTPLSSFDHDTFSREHGRSYAAFIGRSAKLGQFAILAHSGNIVIEQPLGRLRADNAVTYRKIATNTTQAQPATQVVAHASDRIMYTIHATNTGDKPTSPVLSDRLADVLEYATLVESGGGTLDTNTGILTWPSTQLTPGQQISRQFVIRLNPATPATSRGLSNPASYDCVITNSLGTTLNIPVACPPVKSIETLTSQLPSAPASFGLAGSVLIAITALFFYARARQHREELRLIRRDFNTGALL